MLIVSQVRKLRVAVTTCTALSKLSTQNLAPHSQFALAAAIHEYTDRQQYPYPGLERPVVMLAVGMLNVVLEFILR